MQDGMDISQVLGLDYVALLKSLRHEGADCNCFYTNCEMAFFSFEAELNYFCAGSSLEDSVVRWCCISHAEQKKCEQWALSVKSDPLVCVRAVSVRDCIKKIKVK